jgi:glycosyltransferase 2 family protein
MSDETVARIEVAAGLLVLGLTSISTTRRALAPWEQATFHVLNQLPDGLHPPIWAVMQLGSLGAVPVTSAVAFALGDRPLATRLLVAGTSAWLSAKLVKRIVGRGRPATLFTDLRLRGRGPSGGGFPSGHAAVATALAASAFARSCPAAQLTLTGLAATVGVARVYVGAHLPLDVLGGAALGVTLDAAFKMGAPRRVAVSRLRACRVQSRFECSRRY